MAEWLGLAPPARTAPAWLEPRRPRSYFSASASTADSTTDYPTTPRTDYDADGSRFRPLCHHLRLDVTTTSVDGSRPPMMTTGPAAGPDDVICGRPVDDPPWIWRRPLDRLTT